MATSLAATTSQGSFAFNDVILTQTPQVIDDEIVPGIVDAAVTQNAGIMVNGFAYHGTFAISSTTTGATAFHSVPGPPLTGTWKLADLVVDIRGDLWDCIAAGTPGKWGISGSDKYVALVGGSTIVVPNGSAAGLTIQFSAGSTGNGIVIVDHNGAPIAAAGPAGGWAIFGDNLRVHAGTDIFNSEFKARSDGTIIGRKGDAAGGAGVLAMGAVTTVPTGNPDGSHVQDGSTTIAGGVGWADASGRWLWRRKSGITRMVDEAQVPGSPNVSAVGDWLIPASDTLGTQALVSGDNNKLFFVPVDVSDTTAVYNKVGAYCSVAGVGGTYQQFRFGLWKDDGTGTRPAIASQVADFGIASGGFTSLLSAAPTATLSPTWSFASVGRYWVGVAYQESGAPTSRATLFTSNSPLLNSGVDLSAFTRGWYVTGVSGALPTAGTLVATTVVPFVGLRRSA